METPEHRNFDLYSSKRVSFILATRNRANYLQKSMGEYRKLKGLSDEFIVIDGGSSDNTSGVVNQYSRMIDVFVSEVDHGTADAWNKGIILARGKFIKPLTNDDIIHKEGMEQAIRVMENHPEIDLLVCGGTRQQGEKIWPMFVPPGTNYGTSVKEIFKCGARVLAF